MVNRKRRNVPSSDDPSRDLYGDVKGGPMNNPEWSDSQHEQNWIGLLAGPKGELRSHLVGIKIRPEKAIPYAEQGGQILHKVFRVVL